MKLTCVTAEAAANPKPLRLPGVLWTRLPQLLAHSCHNYVLCLDGLRMSCTWSFGRIAFTCIKIHNLTQRDCWAPEPEDSDLGASGTARPMGKPAVGLGPP